MSQLSLDDVNPPANPNAAFFDELGRPRKLMWCSDSVRIAYRRGEVAECPFRGESVRFMPGGVCCLDVASS